MAPPIYKKKNCPQCGVEHRKQGQFCSQGCHNRFRGARSEETKAKISETKKQWYQSPDGMRDRDRMKLNMKLKAEGRDTITSEDYYIEIPDIDSLSDEEKINW